jgi:hypothetical protein
MIALGWKRGAYMPSRGKRLSFAGKPGRPGLGLRARVRYYKSHAARRMSTLGDAAAKVRKIPISMGGLVKSCRNQVMAIIVCDKVN